MRLSGEFRCHRQENPLSLFRETGKYFQLNLAVMWYLSDGAGSGSAESEPMEKCA